MLTHLHISSYALIDRLDIDFGDGLSTVTGETGAGKSIMLGALSLLLGRRADSSKAPAGSKTVVEGTFNTTGVTGIDETLASLDLDPLPDGELLLRREIAASGRSRAFINDTPVSLTAMNQVASLLVDIHSQHANSRLTDPAFLLEMTDTFASHDQLLGEYRESFDAYRRLHSRIAAIKKAAAQARENEEFIAFRLEHLRKLKPVAGEQERLENRQRILSESSSISETLNETVEILSAADTGVLDALSTVGSLLNRVDLRLLGDDTGIAGRVESARIDLHDVASTLQLYLENVEADPSELERVEARLDALYEAQRRFGVNSEQELISLRDTLARQYAALDPDDRELAGMEEELKTLAHKLRQLAHDLSASRSRSAEAITSRLMLMASSLGMPNLRVSLALESGRLTASGADTPSLLVAFNKNQDLRPVQQVASGGEVSRLMLCLKALMAEQMHLPTIIFDEVDTGVSGDIAHRMGTLMRQMGHSLQVITITHLPQVAAKGVRQYKVYKEDTADATHTRIRLLNEAERQEEIASMLSGAGTTEAARLNARSLLES